MNKAVKTIVSILLLFVIAGLAYAIVRSIQQPVNFNKAVKARETVGIQRMKDIRDLQVAYKSVNGKFASTIDSLILFYNTGKMDVLLQVGSHDDSLAVANTEALRKANKKITQEELYQRYLNGEQVIATLKTTLNVKDTLFRSRTNFVADSLKYIPFSGKQLTEMEATIKKVSGVDVPLFEARMPYKKLLKGLDNQLRINLDAEKRAQNRYEGLQVGSISAPNNNAGNWE
ncbi:MAG: hypothetical protein IJ255_00410 [Bacteroidales bacterium]|nr:hypothetical protein [Bacteroidales bacterium]